MNKTKRTLLISSFIMMLALVVTIVGVSAAWFSNSTYKTNDNFIIGSDTISEFASIKVDSTIQGQGGTSVWPAITSKGYLMSGVAPSFSNAEIKGETENVHISQGARCANIYFPIKFVGGSDSGATDGRKSLKLCLDSVTIDKYSTFDDKDNVIAYDYDFREDFNVEMSIVSVVDNTPVGVIEPDLATNDVYYEQTNGVKGDQCDLYLLVRPGVEYYVCATVYFNDVDEECNPELLYTTIRFNFRIDQEVKRLATL